VDEKLNFLKSAIPSQISHLIAGNGVYDTGNSDHSQHLHMNGDQVMNSEPMMVIDGEGE
jgi:hypothetical protein